MKKLIFLFSTISIISLLCFFSCEFAEDDDNLLSAPSVTSTENSNTIAVSHERLSSSNERVNIERIKANDSSAKAVLIATLYPKKIDEEILTFQDRLIHKDTKYKYRFIFINSDSDKYYSKWSAPVKAKNGYTESGTPNLSYNIGSQKFEYDIQNSANSIKLDSAIPALNDGNTSEPIENFVDDFSPVLVLKADDVSTAFDLTAAQMAGTTSFELRTLPRSYNDKPIYCLGIAAKYDVKENSSDLVRTEWTELVPIKIVYSANTSEEAKYLYISSSTSTGTPY